MLSHSPSPLEISWILLDFDNTVMATEHITIPSLVNRFNALYKHLIAYPLTPQFFEAQFQGKSRHSLCESLSYYFQINVEYEALYDSREQDVISSFQENLVEMAPYILETLTEVKKNYGLALVTNSPLQRVFSALRWASNGKGSQLACLFETAFFESGTQPKPKPDVYLHTMNQLKTSPEYCIVVEDSIAGATSSINAGIKTYGYTGFTSHAHRRADQLKSMGVTECFQDWRDFIKLIPSPCL